MFVHGEWMCAVDGSLPNFLRVGRGSALFVSGWIFHRRSPLRSLALRLGDVEHPVLIHSMPRLDVYRAHGRRDDDPSTAAYRSGFWAVVPVPGTSGERAADLTLEATTAGGDRWVQRFTTITFRPSPAQPAAADPQPGLIAICMATHNPEIELFRRQVESIRAQTHESWRCIVNDDLSRPDVYAAIERELADDPRFELHRNTQRLQFYFNFEQALQRVPPEAEAVALCDQDDEWYPDKLGTLLAALREGATLAYSDQRIVRPDGELVAPSYWISRRNQWTDLRTLLLANTVTGAASLFRRELLDVALPFPPRLAAFFHDHWLAAVALASGRITYVDQPLYDYVQHGDQVIGHAGAHGAQRMPPVDRDPLERELLLRGQADYFKNVLPQQLVATVLLERLDGAARLTDRAMLRRLAAGDATPAGVWEQLRVLPRARRAVTDNHDREAAAGVAWRRWSRLRAGRSRPPYGDERHTVHPRPDYVDYGPDNYPHMPHRDLTARLAPPRLEIDPAAPARVNLLLTDGRDRELLAALAMALPRDGLGTRVVEEEGGELVVSPDDLWLAAGWCAAHRAAAAAAQLGRRGFVYAIAPTPRAQPELAPLVEASYRLSHRPLFVGELVRGYFEAHRLGAYAAGGEGSALVIEAPVGQAVADQDDLASRHPRSLVVAASDRAAAELALAAVDAAIVSGAIDPRWELWAGPWAADARVPLAHGRFLEPLSPEAWPAACARADIGLALGLIPEPGPAALRLAAAGAIVVVPTIDGVSAEKVEACSANLLVAASTPDGFAHRLADAVARVDDVAARRAGAIQGAPRDWQDALSGDVVRQLVALLEETR